MSTIIKDKKGFSLFSKLSNRGFTESREKGFTLVEAVVVAVIILILAGVAIPIYLGFVSDARQNTVDNLAETAAAAANTFYRKTGSTNFTDSDLDLHYDDSKYDVDVATGNQTVTVSEKDGAGSNKFKIVSYQ